MAIATARPQTGQPCPPARSSRPPLRRGAEALLRNPAAWYAGFAVYAAGVALFSGLGQDHWWGTWAAGGYAVAAMVAACRRTRGGQLAALAAAVAGALVAPFAWLGTQAPATPDVAVVVRSGALLLHHGTPYLPPAQLAHGGWLAYNPYLPVMAIFGLPKALGLPGLLGDPRPWLAAATFGLLVSAFWITAGRRPAYGATAFPRTASRLTARRTGALGISAFALASPVLAFPLVMGITDPPIIALICLALALLTRVGARAWQPAVVLGVACAMKYTAWPALAVVIVMVATRDGARAALRFCGASLGTAIALAVALAPAALATPAAIIQNTVAYPLGLTAARSPAQSPLPGHLLATLGHTGHTVAIVLLAAAGLALAVSLLMRPPATPARAAARIAVGLTALFTLSPATRFGYFVYPLAFFGWAALSVAVKPLTRLPASGWRGSAGSPSARPRNGAQAAPEPALRTARRTS